jgi:hypothetical protein
MLIQLILGLFLLAGAHNDRLLFQTNLGQAPADVRYVLETAAYHLHFKRGEVIFYFGNNAIRVQFGGYPVKRVPTGNARLDKVVRYIDSGDTQKPDVPTFAAVKYEALYSGVDLSCYGRGGQLECDFVVMPQADPGQIRLAVDGADRIKLDPAGDLALEAGGETLHVHKPTALQIEHGARNPVDVRYQITGGEIGIVVGQYHHGIPLIIDCH